MSLYVDTSLKYHLSPCLAADKKTLQKTLCITGKGKENKTEHTFCPVEDLAAHFK